MPPRKKQKTGGQSSTPTQEDDSSSSRPRKDAKKGRDVKTIPSHEYVCINRPFFDFEAEQYASEGEKDQGEIHENYVKAFEEEKASGKLFEPAIEHKDWKWVALWEAWKMFCDFKDKAKWCDPDNFGMYIYNDWKGHGIYEQVENVLVAFDKALKKKDEQGRFQMWAVISSVAYWLNDSVDGGMDFIHSDNGSGARFLNELLGCALLTALAAIENEGELKSGSKYLDLEIVIGSFLSWSNGLEAYGIKDEAIFWRPRLVEYYNKAGLDPVKGVFGTANLLESLKEGSEKDKARYGHGYEEDKSGRTDKDPWAWGKKLRKYKQEHGPTMGGSKFDITKMTRKERARYAFDGKDPLQHIPEKEIKAGNIALA